MARRTLSSRKGEELIIARGRVRFQHFIHKFHPPRFQVVDCSKLRIHSSAVRTPVAETSDADCVVILVDHGFEVTTTLGGSPNEIFLCTHKSTGKVVANVEKNGSD